MDSFLFSWQRAWAGIGAAGEGGALFARLMAAYAEPQRHYHTQQHLAECLEHLAAAYSLASEPGEVELALWFHDAIYDIKAPAGVTHAQIVEAAGDAFAARDRGRRLTVPAGCPEGPGEYRIGG